MLSATELEAAHSAIRRVRMKYRNLTFTGKTEVEEEEIEAIVRAVDAERQKRGVMESTRSVLR